MGAAILTISKTSSIIPITSPKTPSQLLPVFSDVIGFLSAFSLFESLGSVISVSSEKIVSLVPILQTFPDDWI